MPYGTYSVFLNGSGTAYGTLVVSGNTQTLSGATTGNGTYVLPGPVQVAADDQPPRPARWSRRVRRRDRPPDG